MQPLCLSCWLYGCSHEAVAPPCATNRLISWQIAIRVLLWHHMGILRHECICDPHAIQWGLLSFLQHHMVTLCFPTGSDFSLSTAAAGDLLTLLTLALCLTLSSRLHACLKPGTAAIVCQAKGIFFSWRGLKLILAGFIAVLQLIIKGCKWLLFNTYAHAAQQLTAFVGLHWDERIWSNKIYFHICALEVNPIF